MSRIYLSLGSNMGDSFYYLLQAIIEINKLTNTKVSKISKFYKTKAWGLTEQPDFINCCIELHTDLLPFDLLKKINEIEAKLDRVREVHWGPRTIDIDIIFYDNLKINDEKLTIPHKYYKQRNFVLIPLLDIIWNKNLVLPYIDKKTKNELTVFTYPKKIAISACFLGDNVKYNGGNNYNSLFFKFHNLDFLKICPELFGGLPIPRVPAEKIKNLVFNKNNENITSEFVLGAEKTLNLLKKNNIDIAIMKSKSPSCGFGKIYDGTFSGNLITSNGVTVDLLIKNSIKIISG